MEKVKKNSLKTINEILFKQLDRLDMDGMSIERLSSEVARANALSGTSKVILSTIQTQINVNKLQDKGASIFDEIGLENEE